MEAYIPPTKEQREYLKEWLKTRKDFRNATPDITKPFDNRFTLRQHYVGGCVALHFHVGFAQRGKRYAKDLCTEFEALVGWNDEVLNADIVKDTAWKEHVGCGNQDWINYPVFVRIRQGAKDGEFVSFRVASLVRLKFMDDCSMAGKHVLEGVGARKLFRDDIRAWGFDNYREPDPASPVSGGAFTSLLVKGELPNEMVQHGTQVMDSVANQDAEVAQREIRDCCDPKDMAARLRVELTDDSYLIGSPKNRGPISALRESRCTHALWSLAQHPLKSGW